MKLTVLNVAYPLATVGVDAVGGAEQVVALVDRGLVAAGHRSLVVAQEGSRCAGTLLGIPPAAGRLGGHEHAGAQARCREAIQTALARWPVDAVHLHGIDFPAYLPPPGPPALITLHLPPSWYPPSVFQIARPRTYLHCVSAAQRRACPPSAVLLPDIENGVPVDELAAAHGKRGYAAALGRICWEKGFHLALDAAKRADLPLLLGGQVFPYEEHEAYFREQIVPRLDARRRFLGPLDFARKRRLLTGASALLVPSLVPETGSLVAMEALACGTPVIAFRNGVLADIVEDGVTGFLVDSIDAMAAALPAARRLDPAACRSTARRRFSAERTVAKYLQVYHQLAAEGAAAAETAKERSYAA